MPSPIPRPIFVDAERPEEEEGTEVALLLLDVAIMEVLLRRKEVVVGLAEAVVLAVELLGDGLEALLAFRSRMVNCTESTPTSGRPL